jgi:ATP adenylyltransferase/5',5'''-P-1,P-4-tetraphosphate phosphorylase II
MTQLVQSFVHLINFLEHFIHDIGISIKMSYYVKKLTQVLLSFSESEAQSISYDMIMARGWVILFGEEQRACDLLFCVPDSYLMMNFSFNRLNCANIYFDL